MTISPGAAVAATMPLPHPYPLIRCGGLFLICVGIGLLLAWGVERLWIPLAIAGGVAGLAASGLSARPLSLGAPSAAHVVALVGAVVVEMSLIAYVAVKFRGSDWRVLILSVLLVVGLHFLIMGLAYGPPFAALGVLTMINAGVGLRVRAAPVRAVGLVDGLLKIVFGVWMLALYPAFTLA